MDEIAANDEVSRPKSADVDPSGTSEADGRTVDTVGATTNGEQPSSPKKSEDTDMKDVVTSTEFGEKKIPSEPSEAVKDHGDNGEEVVEGEEDTVIY